MINFVTAFYRASHCMIDLYLLSENHIYKNVPPTTEKLRERYKQADRISTNVCTYFRHLADFFSGRHVALGSVQYTHSTAVP